MQLACFERLGTAGWAALAEVCERARERGLLVIADGKRGDIDISARAYGQAFFGSTETPFGVVRGLGVDALTVNPLLGAEALAPLAEAARRHEGGLFVLVRTTNPGAAELQDLPLAGGGTVSERLAEIAARLAAPAAQISAPCGEARSALCGEARSEAASASPAQASQGMRARSRGIGEIGAVVAATAPERLARLRELLPSAPFLIPGVGAQGGRLEELRPAFAPGRAGGLVTVSRGIVEAHRGTGSDPARAAAREAARLRQLAWALSG